jgi:hypothetical protein
VKSGHLIAVRSQQSQPVLTSTYGIKWSPSWHDETNVLPTKAADNLNILTYVPLRRQLLGCRYRCPDDRSGLQTKQR